MHVEISSSASGNLKHLHFLFILAYREGKIHPGGKSILSRLNPGVLGNVILPII